MKYIKLFENHSGYEDFVSGGTMEKPNISHCVQENDVHYNSLIDKVLVVKYVPELLTVLIEQGDEVGQNVYDTQIVPTQLYFYNNNFGVLGSNMFSKVEIDGVEVLVSDLDASGGTYQFSTESEHTVVYTLKDPTFIGVEIEGEGQSQTLTKLGAIFNRCYCIESVEIPNSVTNIGYNAFYYCNNLTSVTIPNSVTRIGESAFDYCNNLTNITIPNSVTSIGRNAFRSCTSLSVTIPDSVTTIGNNAFCGTNLDAATQAKIRAINSNGICEILK